MYTYATYKNHSYGVGYWGRLETLNNTSSYTATAKSIDIIPNTDSLWTVVGGNSFYWSTTSYNSTRSHSFSELFTSNHTINESAITNSFSWEYQYNLDLSSSTISGLTKRSIVGWNQGGGSFTITITYTISTGGLGAGSGETMDSVLEYRNFAADSTTTTTSTYNENKTETLEQETTWLSWSAYTTSNSTTTQLNTGSFSNATLTLTITTTTNTQKTYTTTVSGNTRGVIELIKPYTNNIEDTVVVANTIWYHNGPTPEQIWIPKSTFVTGGTIRPDLKSGLIQEVCNSYTRVTISPETFQNSRYIKGWSIEFEVSDWDYTVTYGFYNQSDSPYSSPPITYLSTNTTETINTVYSAGSFSVFTVFGYNSDGYFGQLNGTVDNWNTTEVEPIFSLLPDFIDTNLGLTFTPLRYEMPMAGPHIGTPGNGGFAFETATHVPSLLQLRQANFAFWGLNNEPNKLSDYTCSWLLRYITTCSSFYEKTIFHEDFNYDGVASEANSYISIVTFSGATTKALTGFPISHFLNIDERGDAVSYDSVSTYYRTSWSSGPVTWMKGDCLEFYTRTISWTYSRTIREPATGAMMIHYHTASSSYLPKVFKPVPPPGFLPFDLNTNVIYKHMYATFETINMENTDFSDFNGSYPDWNVEQLPFWTVRPHRTLAMRYVPTGGNWIFRFLPLYSGMNQYMFPFFGTSGANSFAVPHFSWRTISYPFHFEDNNQYPITDLQKNYRCKMFYSRNSTTDNTIALTINAKKALSLYRVALVTLTNSDNGQTYKQASHITNYKNLKLFMTLSLDNKFETSDQTGLYINDVSSSAYIGFPYDEVFSQNVTHSLTHHLPLPRITVLNTVDRADTAGLERGIWNIFNNPYNYERTMAGGQHFESTNKDTIIIPPGVYGTTVNNIAGKSSCTEQSIQEGDDSVTALEALKNYSIRLNLRSPDLLVTNSSAQLLTNISNFINEYVNGGYFTTLNRYYTGD